MARRELDADGQRTAAAARDVIVATPDFGRDDQNRTVVVPMFRRCVVRRSQLASRAALVSQRASRTLFVALLQHPYRQMTDPSTRNHRIPGDTERCVRRAASA